LILLAIALEGFIAGPLYWWERVLAAGAGLSCLTLSANGVLIAAALALAGLARSTIGWWRRRRAETATAEEPGPRC
jgi:hypothetical protein